jgi:hypothetical protein
MSFLTRIEEEWFQISQTTKLRPVGHPPEDDGVLALTMFGFVLLAIAISVGQCLAH